MYFSSSRLLVWQRRSHDTQHIGIGKGEYARDNIDISSQENSQVEIKDICITSW